MTRILLACYRHFLNLYPREFRTRYGRELQLFVRDYARDHGSLAFGMFLFSDLLLSVPREHVREATMQKLTTVIAAVLLLGFVGIHLVYDASHQEVRMGFLLLMMLTTFTIVAAVLLFRPRPRFMWFIPAAYAAAAASWLIVTPLHVNEFAPLRPFIFSLGRPGAIAFLYVPVLIALMPMVWPKPTIATVAMLVFIVAATGLVGTFYAPAALAMVLLRYASSHRGMEPRSVY